MPKTLSTYLVDSENFPTNAIYLDDKRAFFFRHASSLQRQQIFASCHASQVDPSYFCSSSGKIYANYEQQRVI